MKVGKSNSGSEEAESGVGVGGKLGVAGLIFSLWAGRLRDSRSLRTRGAAGGLGSVLGVAGLLRLVGEGDLKKSVMLPCLII